MVHEPSVWTAKGYLAAVMFALGRDHFTENVFGALVPDVSQLARLSPEAQAKWHSLADRTLRMLGELGAGR